MIKHHIVQRKFGWSNHEVNLHTRDQRFERAYHLLFPDMLPIERINRILHLDSTAYNPDVVREVKRVIDEVRSEWIDAYDYRCFKWNNIFNK